MNWCEDSDSSFEGFRDECSYGDSVPEGFPLEEQVVFGYSNHFDYEGSAYVLWLDSKGILREKDLSHCSCNCYSEDSDWLSATTVTLEYLRKRSPDYCREDYQKALNDLEQLLAVKPSNDALSYN